MTDIVKSTQKIAKGRYREVHLEVHLLGASSIIAVLSVLCTLEIPFIWGVMGVPRWQPKPLN